MEQTLAIQSFQRVNTGNTAELDDCGYDTIELNIYKDIMVDLDFLNDTVELIEINRETDIETSLGKVSNLPEDASITVVETIISVTVHIGGTGFDTVRLTHRTDKESE